MQFNEPEWFGRFLVSAIFQAFREIQTGKNKKDNEKLLACLKAWDPLMTQLRYYKMIHNLCQTFLQRYHEELFGNNDNPDRKTISEDTSPKYLKDIWKRSYKEDFFNRIESFMADSNVLMPKSTTEKLDLNKSDINIDQSLKININKLENFGIKAQQEVLAFLKELDTISKTIDDSSHSGIEKWSEAVDVFEDVRKSDASDEIKDKAYALLLQALFLDAKTMLANRKYEDAADAFRKIDSRFPGCEYGDVALFNAAEAYEKMEKLPKACDCYFDLVKGYSDSKLAPEGLFNAAGNYEKIDI